MRIFWAISKKHTCKTHEHIQISIRQFFILWRTNGLVFGVSNFTLEMESLLHKPTKLFLFSYRYESAKIKPALTATHLKWTHQLETLGFIELTNKAETRWAKTKKTLRNMSFQLCYKTGTSTTIHELWDWSGAIGMAWAQTEKKIWRWLERGRTVDILKNCTISKGSGKNVLKLGNSACRIDDFRKELERFFVNFHYFYGEI